MTINTPHINNITKGLQNISTITSLFKRPRIRKSTLFNGIINNGSDRICKYFIVVVSVVETFLSE